MTSEKELFRLCKILMIFAGVWSQKIPNAGPFYQILYKIYSVSNQFSYTSSLIFFSVELYKFINDNDIDKAMENLSRMIFVFLVSCKFKLCQSKKIIKLLELADKEEQNVNSSKDVRTLNIYLDHVIYCKRVIIVLTFFTINAGTLFVGDGFYAYYKFYKNHIGEARSLLEKPFPLPLWYPFNKNKYYFLTMSQQVLNITQSMVFNIAIQALVHSVMVFIKAQLKILQHKLKNLMLYDEDKKKNIYMEKDKIYVTLKAAARKHQELIRWVEQFNDSIKYLLLLEYGVTSLMLASTLIQVFQRNKIIFNIFFFTLCLLQIFMLAWNANEILLESSQGLYEALYKSKWYEQSPPSKTLIFFMMMRCQRPLALSIGAFGPMTVDAAVSRVKLAYTFLSVMSTN